VKAEEEGMREEEEEEEEEGAGDIAGHATTIRILLPGASVVTQVQSESCGSASRRTLLLKLAISSTCRKIYIKGYSALVAINAQKNENATLLSSCPLVYRSLSVLRSLTSKSGRVLFFQASLVDPRAYRLGAEV
jgi:hypothetical protein